MANRPTTTHLYDYGQDAYVSLLGVPTNENSTCLHYADD